MDKLVFQKFSFIIHRVKTAFNISIYGLFIQNQELRRHIMYVPYRTVYHSSIKKFIWEKINGNKIQEYVNTVVQYCNIPSYEYRKRIILVTLFLEKKKEKMISHFIFVGKSRVIFFCISNTGSLQKLFIKIIYVRPHLQNMNHIFLHFQ